MKKVVGLVIGLLPISAGAECVPAPDCVSIGYTETSCDGDSVKCPFDTSKLYCVPCDSSFRYTCTGENIIGGIGITCNGKYVACECEDRTSFINGECVCDTSCNTVGNIVYSDQTCSSCNHSDKTPVAVVVYKNENNSFITPLITPSLTWSSVNIDIASLDNFGSEDPKTDMNGKSNTKKIVDSSTSDNENNNAAWYCYNLELEGWEEYKNQWYLPSTGELYNYYCNSMPSINNTLSLLEMGDYNNVFWTSSEQGTTTAWGVRPNVKAVGNNFKSNSLAVTCLLAI